MKNGTRGDDGETSSIGVVEAALVGVEKSGILGWRVWESVCNPEGYFAHRMVAVKHVGDGCRTSDFHGWDVTLGRAGLE